MSEVLASMLAELDLCGFILASAAVTLAVLVLLRFAVSTAIAEFSANSSSADTATLHLPPVVRSGLPYFRSALPLLTSPVTFWNTYRQEFGDIFTAIVCGRRYTFLFGSAGVRFLASSSLPCSNNPSHRLYPSYFYSDSQGVGWFHETLNTYLRSPQFDSGIQDLAIVIDEFWDSFPTAGQFAVFETFDDLAFRLATAAFAGKELHSEFFDEWRSLYEETDVLYGIMNGNAHVVDPRIWWRRGTVFVQLQRLVQKVVERRLAVGDGHFDDYFQMLIGSVLKEMSNTTSRRQTSETSTMSAASALNGADADMTLACGVDVSRMLGRLYQSVTAAYIFMYLYTAWTLLRILTRSGLVTQLIQEIETAIAITNGSYTTETLHRMPLLESCIYETMRLGPPVLHLKQLTHAQTVEGDQYIPAGDYVGTCSYFSHRDPSVYTNPDEFQPDRFARALADKRPLPLPFYPSFDNNACVCSGARFFPLPILKLNLAVFLLRFEAAPVSRVPEPEIHCFSVSNRPAEDCLLSFSTRHAKQ